MSRSRPRTRWASRRSRRAGWAETEALLRASVRLADEARDEVAREDAGGPRDRWVAASVGPYGATLGDGSEYAGSSGLSRAELRRWHAPRFAVLADAGADLLACETIPSLDEGLALVDLARGSGASAWLAFTVADGRLRSGEPMAEGFRLAEEADEVVAVGINCAHPEEVPAAIAAARSVTDRPVVVYPNSGERWDAVARAWGGDPALPSVDAWVQAGASLVGGCCRVGPDEIRRMRDALG
jgi:homocysteine S-methyltransferase